MNTSLFMPTKKDTRGLSLVELVVVLLILALLAGTAITTTHGVLEETLYESTRTTLERIDEAVLGPYAPPTAHDDTLIEGFVADVGRLPKVVGTNPELALAELWTLPDGVVSFELQPPPPGDSELRVPAGWRGPYLHTGLDATRVLDGWGRAFRVFKQDGTPAAQSEEISRIASVGSDELDGVADADPDVVIASAVVLPRHLARLTIRLEPAIEGGSTADVLVRVYGPDGVDGVVRALFQHSFVNGVPSHEFPAVPVGPRVVRAYQWPSDTDPPLPSDNTALEPRSAPVTVRLARRGASEIVLKIWNPDER